MKDQNMNTRAREKIQIANEEMLTTTMHARATSTKKIRRTKNVSSSVKTRTPYERSTKKNGNGNKCKADESKERDI